MAIDSENKRRSVQAYFLGLMRPLADGLVDSEDRAVAAWLYFREAGAAVLARMRTSTVEPRQSFKRSNVQPDYIRRG